MGTTSSKKPGQRGQQQSVGCCAGQRDDGPNPKFFQLLTEPKKSLRARRKPSQDNLIGEIKHRKHQLGLLFMDYDLDSDGKLDMEELRILASNMENRNTVISDNKIREIMLFLNNGRSATKLGDDEFKQNMYSSLNVKQVPEKVFDQIVENLRMKIATPKEGANVTNLRHRLIKIFEMYDRDEDGKLVRDEFGHFARAFDLEKEDEIGNLRKRMNKARDTVTDGRSDYVRLTDFVDFMYNELKNDCEQGRVDVMQRLQENARPFAKMRFG